MADENNIEMNTDPLKRYGKYMTKFIKDRLRALVTYSMVDLQKDIRTNRFIAYDGGHHDNLLMRRSGHLSNSIRPRRTVEVGPDFVGGLETGKAYGSTLIGRRGKVTVIVPRLKKFLAIPLPAALDGHGVPRGRALDKAVWGSTFIHKGIIFGQPLFVKGKKKGESKGMIVPLFVLKRSVRVPVKIAVEDLRDYALKSVGKDLRKLRDDLGLK